MFTLHIFLTLYFSDTAFKDCNISNYTFECIQIVILYYSYESAIQMNSKIMTHENQKNCFIIYDIIKSRKYLHFTTLLQTYSNISWVSLVSLLPCVYGLLYR